MGRANGIAMPAPVDESRPAGPGRAPCPAGHPVRRGFLPGGDSCPAEHPFPGEDSCPGEHPFPGRGFLPGGASLLGGDSCPAELPSRRVWPRPDRTWTLGGQRRRPARRPASPCVPRHIRLMPPQRPVPPAGGLSRCARCTTDRRRAVSGRGPACRHGPVPDRRPRRPGARLPRLSDVPAQRRPRMARGARRIRSVGGMPLPTVRGVLAGVPGAAAGAAPRADGRGLTCRPAPR